MNHAIIPLVEKVNNALDSVKIVVSCILLSKEIFDTIDTLTRNC